MTEHLTLTAKESKWLRDIKGSTYAEYGCVPNVMQSLLPELSRLPKRYVAMWTDQESGNTSIRLTPDGEDYLVTHK